MCSVDSRLLDSIRRYRFFLYFNLHHCARTTSITTHISIFMSTQPTYCMCQFASAPVLVEHTTYLLATGLSLICMVLSSWLFVLGRLKLLFFLWRREQQEPRPCGDEDTEEAREPDLFITEMSMQFAWKVCSSTNS